MAKFSKKIYQTSTLKIKNLSITILRKAVRKIYLRVSTQDGSIKLIAPRNTSDEYLNQIITSKINWIEKYHQQFLKKTPNVFDFKDGKSIELFGQQLKLKINNNCQKKEIFVNESYELVININNNNNQQEITKMINSFYRIELKKTITSMVFKWQKIMKVKSNFIGIRKMKTKWGSCNYTHHKLWFSSELAKKPLLAIEYVVVHELSHLIEPSHNKRFVAIMNRFLPNWQERKAILK